MEKIDRNLIIVDMCSRIPYCVKVCYEHPKTYKDAVKELTYDTDIYELVTRYHGLCYLRPISSMTEEELKKIMEIDERRGVFSSRHLTLHLDGEVIDYLNRRMLDWRGLIPIGLALEAPEGMYNLK